MAYTPKTTTILNEIAARLAKVTVANGYNNTLKAIARARSEPFNGYDLPAVNYYHGNISIVQARHHKTEHTMELIIEAHTKSHDEPFINLADSLDADIVISLYRATTAPKVSDTVNLNLGGLVEQFKYVNFDPFIGGGEKPFCGAFLKFNIIYETTIGTM